MSIIILSIAICCLNLIDCIQTVYAVQLFGIGIESNPIARFMFEHNCAVPMKLIVVPTLLAVMGVITNRDKRFIWALYCILALYAYVVTHNFAVLFQMGAL